MKLKKTFTSLDRNLRHLDSTRNDYQTISDLMREQNVSNKYDEFWKKECELIPFNPRCLEYDD